MVAMWERMAQWFGGRWEREYGNVQDQTIHAWTGALQRYDVEDIIGAMQAMAEWDSPHPPTFPEFRGLVLASKAKRKPSWTEDRLEAERTRGKGVAGVLADLGKGRLTETGKAELAKIRAIVEGKANEG